MCLLLSTAEEGRPPLGQLPVSHSIQPFFQKPRTPTVAKEFQIGLCEVVEADKKKIKIGLHEVVEADWKLFCNYWSGESFGERLYVVHDGCTPTRKIDRRWLVGALCPLQRGVPRNPPCLLEAAGTTPWDRDRSEVTTGERQRFFVCDS